MPGLDEDEPLSQGFKLGLQKMSGVEFLKPQIDFFDIIGAMISFQWEHPLVL